MAAAFEPLALRPERDRPEDVAHPVRAKVAGSAPGSQANVAPRNEAEVVTKVG
jgi:hypothetical protein